MDEYDDLVEIISNAHYNNNFLALAREVRQWRAHRTSYKGDAPIVQTHAKLQFCDVIILLRVCACLITCIDIVDFELGKYLGMEL